MQSPFMPRLKPESSRTTIKKLRQLGYDGPYGGGRHIFMRHPETKHKIPVPAHGGRDIPIGTLRAMLRQLDISVQDWLEL